MKIKAALVLLAALHINAAYANLTLNIDVNTKELYITGSTVVDTGGSIGTQWLTWENDNPYSAPNKESFTLQSHQMTVSEGPSYYNPSIVISLDGRLRLQRVCTELYGDPITVTGTGTRYSYASLFDPYEEALENYSGEDLPAAYGIQSDPVEVNIIPEPSSAILIALVGGAGFFARHFFMI